MSALCTVNIGGKFLSIPCKAADRHRRFGGEETGTRNQEESVLCSLNIGGQILRIPCTVEKNTKSVHFDRSTDSVSAHRCVTSDEESDKIDCYAKVEGIMHEILCDSLSELIQKLVPKLPAAVDPVETGLGIKLRN